VNTEVQSIEGSIETEISGRRVWRFDTGLLATHLTRWIESASGVLTGWKLVRVSKYEEEDVSQQSREAAPAYLMRYSLRDPLTQLPNRAAFIHRLDSALDQSRSDDSPAPALLCIDIDRFKVVNESLGQALGDEFLAGAAERMGQVIGRNDTLARLGGDNFAVLMEDVDSPNTLKSATSLAKLIMAELGRHVLVGRHDVNASASIGVAVVTTDYRGAEEVVRDAEIAMYRAKQLGGARVEIFDEDMLAQAKDSLALEMDLRHALERNEFELFYQPIVSAKTGEFAAFEALIRWRHPSRGLLAPGDFLGLLHETGLIVPTGRWVVAEVCRQASRWEIACGRVVPISFNLSAREFGEPGIVETIMDAISEAGVEASAITVEITEDALIENEGSGPETLALLSDNGLRLLIDDFGTGYSSLGYLGRLPARGLKIPRELVARIHKHPQDRAIVAAIAALAHSLSLEVVAEGVENLEQLVELRAIDCAYIQGYFISPPVDALTAGRMLESPWTIPEVENNASPAPSTRSASVSGRKRAPRKRGAREKREDDLVEDAGVLA